MSCGSILDMYCGSIHRRADGLALARHFAWLPKESPTPRLRVGRGVAPTSVPRRLRKDDEREVVPNA